MGRGSGCVQGWGWGRGLGGLPTSRMLCAGGMLSALLLFRSAAFSPGSLKAAFGFFWSLCIICLEFAITEHSCCYFQSCIVSLYIIQSKVVAGELCPHASKAVLQQRVSSSLTPVSALAWKWRTCPLLTCYWTELGHMVLPH